MRRSPSVLFVCCIAALICGCGKKGPSIATYPVTGTVIYNGNPVSGATVAYVSKNPDAHRSTAVTDAEGKFSLATYIGPTQVLKGAEPGDYQVVISKQTMSGGPAGMDSASLDTPEKRQENMTKMWEQQKPPQGGQTPPPSPKFKSEIPIRYAKVETSGLTATVLSGDNDPREFKLSDD